MITCYRITDGQFSGVDLFEVCPDNWTTTPVPTEPAPAGMAYQWANGAWEVGFDRVIMAKRKNEAHAAAWDYIYRWHDTGGLLQLADWKYDPNVSAQAKAMIAAVDAWKNLVMGLYAQKRAAILAGQEADLDYSAAGDCPHKFMQIAAIAQDYDNRQAALEAEQELP